jgi:transcriptional regulator GlxA family with amidase domain
VRTGHRFDGEIAALATNSRDAKHEYDCRWCRRALVLAAAGLLKDHTVTRHHGAFDRLPELEPSRNVSRDQRFTVSDNKRVWTSGGISAGIDMSLAIVQHLLGDNAKVVEEMEWMWHAKLSR